MRLLRPVGFAVALLLMGCDRARPAPPQLSIADAKAFLEDGGLQKSHLSPYVRGKVVVLSRTGPVFEAEVQKLLPAALRAETRSDVQTVVWLDWSTEKIPGLEYGTFVRDGKSQRVPALAWVADVTVIDWSRKLILGGPRFTGSAPTGQYLTPSREDLLRLGGVTGPRPFQEIATYLDETSRSIAVPP
jgi:hypothetical protein